MDFLERAPRYLFFTGKGGVGKTSLACASGVALADRGRRVLIVSTDPASNLDAVLGVALGNQPRDVPGASGLSAMNIDPQEAAREYRERTVRPYRGVLPDTKLAMLEERLSGACTVEIAAFDEFTLLLGTDSSGCAFDHVIFDTAPTGHTLRLLQLPAAWAGYLESGTADASCLGPLSSLKAQQSRYADAVRTLADPQETVLVLVARPERVTLIEAARTSNELRLLGLENQHLVLNGIFRASDPSDPIARAYERRGQTALAGMPDELKVLPRTDVPLRAYNVVGLPAVRAFLDDSAEPGRLPRRTPGDLNPTGMLSLATLVDQLAPQGHGLIMVMGKGGVGKTTVAAAIAIGLATRGHPVHLTTTDPAQHLRETLTAEVSGLRVSWIDPAVEARRYRDEMLKAKGKALDATHRALLEEDLRSPCYDEVAVFQAFSRVIGQARKQFVIVDTAPTGHTLLLLDTAGAYEREIARSLSGTAMRVATPLTHLRNADYTKVLIVTLPETTPVLEAAALQEDLRRAGIEPYAWVINASLAAALPTDLVLRQRGEAELGEIDKVRNEHARRVVLMPFLAEEPVGSERLSRLASPPENGHNGPGV